MNIKPIFLSWEKLRIIYNIILLLVFMTTSVSALYFNDSGAVDISIINFLMQSFFLALAANALYFFGPVFDSYLLWLGSKFKYQMHLIFIFGLLLSVVLEIGFLSSMLSPF